MSRKNALHHLPPIALAEALDHPYRPGRKRRQILIGVAVVAALLAVFLAWMSRHDGAVRTRVVDVSQDAAPRVVYQNLRVPPAPPPSHSADGATSHDRQTLNGDSR